MERCPNCRARVSGTEYCRRCGMALNALLALEAAANRHISLAFRQLLDGEPVAAIATLQRARSLKDDAFTEQLLLFASGLAQASGRRHALRHEIEGQD